MRSDQIEDRYKGVRTARLGEIIIEFVYEVGEMDYAVNICRVGTNECTRMSGREWEQLCMVAPQMRAIASDPGGNNHSWAPWLEGH